MDGSQFSMDGEPQEWGSGSGSSSYYDSDRMSEERVRAIIDDVLSGSTPYQIRMSPELPKEEFTRHIIEFMQLSAIHLDKLSFTMTDALKRSGFIDEDTLRATLSSMFQELRTESEERIRVQVKTLRDEMKPIFDMLKDPNLALSARVKAFELT